MQMPARQDDLNPLWKPIADKRIEVRLRDTVKGTKKRERTSRSQNSPSQVMSAFRGGRVPSSKAASTSSKLQCLGQLFHPSEPQSPRHVERE